MNIIIPIIIFYVLSSLAVIALAILSWFIWDKRFKSKNYTEEVPAGFIETTEVFIDPTTERPIKVYFNPQTGERFYKDNTQKRS